jgi:acetyltransferase-like isoleucine patch superfamily enzyme
MTVEQLAELLRRLHVDQDEQLRRDHARSLSFQDGFFNRWERAQRLGFGEGTQVYNSVQVYGDVSIGRSTFVGAFCILDGGYAPMRIGDFVSISAGVHLYTHDTVLWSLTGGRAEKRTGSVMVGDRCYIGSQAIIACGVTIGEQCVIASNSFVNENVPPRTVVAGAPARTIGHVRVKGDDVSVVYHK